MNERNELDDRSRLHQLLFLHEREEISPEQFSELQELLRNNPALQEAYLTYIDLVMEVPSLVGCHSHGFSEADVAVARLALTQAIEEDRRLERPTSPVELRDWRHRLWRPVAMLAVAASIGMMILSISWYRRQRIATNVAENPHTDNRNLSPSSMGPNANNQHVVLLQSSGAVLFREAMPTSGSPLLYNHEYSLIEGLMELQFPNGATTVLNAPTVIEISEADKLIVKVGSCSVHAPPGAEGFRVVTPKAEIIDLGTRFFVGVQDDGQTDLHVVEGEAEIRQLDGGSDPQSLVEHQARRLKGGAESISTDLEFRADDYVGRLPDRIVSYQAEAIEGPHVSKLISVDVQRDGIRRRYRADELIGVKVIHYKGNKGTYCLMGAIGQSLGSEATSGRLSVLESDLFLNSGMLNPGGAIEPLTSDPMIASSDESGANVEALTPGLGIQFKRPVVNAVGPDVVFFEIQPAVEPLEGDDFHVSPLKFREGLKSSTIRRYDISMLSPEAKSVAVSDIFIFDTVPRSLNELLTLKHRKSEPQFRFYALAVGIDLSNLGYEIGESVDGLFLQDAQTDYFTFDPVFIGGLPATDEPLEHVAP